jgi:two-component system cell cycle response regulator DivK
VAVQLSVMEEDLARELILIIEDNEKNRKLVRDVLQFKGYPTIEAATAEEGIDLAREQEPSLILMDIQLPRMDGLTALARLKAEPVTRAIPVIAITASAMPEDLEKIQQAGFDAYQTKPIRIKEFIGLVEKIFESAKGAS